MYTRILSMKVSDVLAIFVKTSYATGAKECLYRGIDFNCHKGDSGVCIKDILSRQKRMSKILSYLNHLPIIQLTHGKI